MPLSVRCEVDTSGIGVSISALESRKATYRAVGTGIRILTHAAKARAPRKSGALKYSQGTKVRKGDKTRTGSYAIQGARKAYKKPNKGGKKPQYHIPAFYDHLVQGGTKPHSIRKGSKLERMLKRGKVQQAVGQDVGKPHPGARANPYRKRAWQSVRSQVMSAMELAMRLEIQKFLALAHAKTMQKVRKSVSKLVGF